MSKRILLTAMGLLMLMALVTTGQQTPKQAAPIFEPPSVLNAVEATYPLQSIASGTVVLEVSLDETGKITDIHVVRGIASLTEAARRSMQQWTFQPAKLNRRPVPSKFAVAFSFVPPTLGPRP